MIENLEAKRLTIQAALDGLKTPEERNRLGQFSTPPPLARDILEHAKGFLRQDQAVHFLDPALGSGAFYAALRSVFSSREIEHAVGFEIDPHYGKPAQDLWEDQGLKLAHRDFTKADPDSHFNLVICNPPYVRHHHINSDDKIRLRERSLAASGCKLSGLAGLYAHFLLQAHAWMAPGAIAGWLIPSEFMDVNYGHEVKSYLLEKVTLLQIHRFSPDDVQFADALVSSSVVWIKNEAPSHDHQPLFTFGGSLRAPQTGKTVSSRELAKEAKWSRFPMHEVRSLDSDIQILGDIFSIKRGIATGRNKFFVLTEEQVNTHKIPSSVLRPILPSPRYLKADVVPATSDGLPVDASHRLFLLDPKMDEDEIRRDHPTLAAYLNEGKELGVHEGYLCRGRKRWYDQEQRPPAPIVCTYMGRSDSKNGRPFRFVRNHSQATVANTYLAMYPKPGLQKRLSQDPSLIDRIWHQLNQLSPEVLLGEGRVYGGGLHKLEPKELGKVPLSLE